MPERVFVSSRAKAPLEQLRLALHNANMTVAGVSESQGGDSLTAATLLAIQQSDYVLVVWDTVQLPPSVLFEAGLAVGVGAHVALLDARTRRDSGDDLTVESFLSVPRLHSRLNDVDGLTRELLALRQVNFQRTSSTTSVFPQSEWPVQVPIKVGESTFETRVLQILDQLGILVLPEPSEKAPRIPDLEGVVPKLFSPFNPVFFELAGRKANLARKRQQLREALLRRGGRVGVVITLDPVKARVETDNAVAIIQIGFEQLEQQPNELDRLLRMARNQLVHGVY